MAKGGAEKTPQAVAKKQGRTHSPAVSRGDSPVRGAIVKLVSETLVWTQFSGVEELTRYRLKRVSNRALLLFKISKQFSALRCRSFISLEKANLPFKSPSPKPRLNRTGSVFALPIFVSHF